MYCKSDESYYGVRLLSVWSPAMRNYVNVVDQLKQTGQFSSYTENAQSK